MYDLDQIPYQSEEPIPFTSNLAMPRNRSLGSDKTGGSYKSIH